MKAQDIFIRDPYILLEKDTYYLYGTKGETAWDGKENSFYVYCSNDLEEFAGPYKIFECNETFWADRHFWAPEVHKVGDKFYLFASFKAEGKRRAMHILQSDNPMGAFEFVSTSPITPSEWDCLDGTLFIDCNDNKYLVFCHEWTQVNDGEICVIQLSDDFTRSISEPILLFKGSDAPWADSKRGYYITDGPFMIKASDDSIIMIWSGMSPKGYCVGAAISDSGNIFGPWRHIKTPIIDEDCGHAMVFFDKLGKLRMAMHYPNNHPNERLVLFNVDISDTGISIEKT